MQETRTNVIVRNWILRIAIILALMAGVATLATRDADEDITRARLVGLETENTGGYRHADGSLALEFPRDFGPHNDFQSEWWYYTGNLQTAQGRHFGFQLTFFRRAIQPAEQRQPRDSDWAAEQVYMAHFTLTDVDAGSFRYFERFSRGSAGLAGAEIDPTYAVWLEDWSVEQVGEDAYRLRAAQDGLALDLRLTDQRGPVLQGENGLSVKGPEPGNASYYYSQTRLLAEGMIRVPEGEFTVSGLSWKDHEYSTSALSPGVVGWDWFSLQLDDGSDLMLYRLRQQDGSEDPFSSGTLVRADGSTRTLTPEDFRITATGEWRSPHSGATYPAGWRIEIPSENLKFEITPYLADQELNLSFVYWEGAVQLRGTQAGQPVTGNGYVELTGYESSMQGRL